MDIRQRREGAVAVVALAGEFDASSLPAVSEAVSQSVVEGYARIVLNVRHASIVTSSAVGYLLEASRHLRSVGGALVLSDPPAWLRRTLDTLGVSDLLSIAPDDDAALVWLRSGLPG